MEQLTGLKADLLATVDRKAPPFVELSRFVWETPELAYKEFRSSGAHRAALEREGFAVVGGYSGMPTALRSEAGRGGALVALLGEYDALPGLSQEAGVAEPRPAAGALSGHGCGHNLLGCASLLAAAALKEWLEHNAVPGRVRYYGCPAEEGGAAKAFLVRDGAFNDVDCAISWHPAAWTGVWEPVSLANMRIDFTFAGRSAHAASSPHLGRSALDACELMSVGVNYLREHMPSDAKVHYAYLDAGGIAPNVVQAQAKVRYLIRSRFLDDLNDLALRVRQVADGAALMTGCTASAAVVSAVSNLLGNRPLEEAMHRNMREIGPPPFDEADIRTAERFRATLREQEVQAAWSRIGLAPQPDKVLCDFIAPLDRAYDAAVGSTDTGDVSWVVPTVQAWCATLAIGTPFHSWQMTAQGITAAAHKGMVHAAKIMAATAADVFLDAGLLADAKAALGAATTRTPYRCPIPEGVRPPLEMSA